MRAAIQEPLRGTSVQLPPAFSLVAAPAGTGAFAFGESCAARLGAGTLVWAESADHLDFAVVLEPAEPLRTARRAFYIGMSALIHAVAAVAPPDKPLAVDWPDAIRFDGARLGGGRLGWPRGAADSEVPAFLIFGATLILSKARSGDPGLTPGSTSFEEEGFEPHCGGAVIEAFARYLLRGFDIWDGQGFAAATIPYLQRLPEPGGGMACTIDEAGNLRRQDDTESVRALQPLLEAPTWLDPRTGTPRL